MVGAVDIGGTKIAVGIVDGNGRVLSRMEVASGTAGTYAEGVRLIVGMMRQSMQSAGVSIAGIGIGSTGPVDPVSGRFGEVDFLPSWRGGNIVADLSQELGVAAVLENDADAAALAETRWGAGKSKSRLIYVTIGTGIGGGIILDGKLYRGVDGAHPEIGHQVIDAAGPLCSCGLHGCWEALAAGPAMAKWMAEQSEHKAGDGITAKQICELAFAGDALALRVIERGSFYLGLGLANLVNLFAPDAIILSGSVMKSAELFLSGVRKVMQQGCRFVPLEKAELKMASLGDDANLIGAACVWHHRFTQKGNLVCQ